MHTKQLEELLAAMLRAGATSLHLIPGRPPCLRVQRRLVRSDDVPIVVGDVEELTKDLLFEDHRQRLRRNGQVEVLYVSRSGHRFRTTVMLQDGGQTMLMRPVPETPPEVAQLELPPQVTSFSQYRSGLVLITGFFGSGKSTTIAALLDRLAGESPRHLVSIEDPIEFLFPTKQALIHQREVGVHVASFADGVREAMRLGADVIAVSDLRDAETLDGLLTAVEGGALVFAALDASSVVGAMNELAGLVAPEERPRLRTRLATALRAVSAQTLLPRSHQQGRVPLIEVLINNSAVRAAIRQGAFSDLAGIMQRYRGLGMQTTDVALRGLLARHLITQEDALQYVVDRDQVLLRAGTAGTPGQNRAT